MINIVFMLLFGIFGCEKGNNCISFLFAELIFFFSFLSILRNGIQV